MQVSMSSPIMSVKGAQSVSADQPPSYEPAASSSMLRSEDVSVSSLPLAFPDVTATASEVRLYIRSFLWHNASKYDLTQADVIRIADAWRYGSGEELRKYDRATWEGLFGAELGLVLMNQVQEEKTTEVKDIAAKSYVANVVISMMSFIMIVLGGYAISIINEEVDDGDDRAALFFMLSICVFVPFIGLLGYNVISLLLKRQRIRKVQAEAKGEYIRLNGGESAV